MDYNHKTIESNIIKDLEDNIGTKLVGLYQISEMTTELLKEENPDKDELKKFLNNIQSYVSTLSTELRIFKWAADPENNGALPVLSKIKSIAENNNLFKCISVKIEHNYKKDYPLPPFWNRQIILLFNDLLAVLCNIKKSKTVTVKIERREVLVNLDISYDGDQILYEELNTIKIARIVNRIGTLKADFKLLKPANNLNRINFILHLHP